jgi:hypothetical protein
MFVLKRSQLRQEGSSKAGINGAVPGDGPSAGWAARWLVAGWSKSGAEIVSVAADSDLSSASVVASGAPDVVDVSLPAAVLAALSEPPFSAPSLPPSLLSPPRRPARG